MTENPTIVVPPPDRAAPRWAVLHLKGHLTLAGLVSEVDAYGARMGRIDVLGRDGRVSHTSYFTGDTVYLLEHVSEEAARLKAATLSPAPVSEYDLPPKARDALRAAERQEWEEKEAAERKALPARQDPIDVDIPFDPGYQADTAVGEVRPFREDDEEPDDDEDDFEDLDPADRPRF